MSDDEAREKLAEAMFWTTYGAVMESLRRGEQLALARWGRVENGRPPKGNATEIQRMRMLWQELEALWVGFEV